MKLTHSDYFVFSGGEVHTKIPASESKVDIPDPRIVCYDYTMNGFMAVCEKAQIIEKRYGVRCSLVYPYFPYARQDRWITQEEPFSLKVFTDLVNSRNFASVTVYDPHSDVVGALLDNCIIVEQDKLARNCLPPELLQDSDVLFVSPDAGAYKKLSKLMENDYRIVLGTKVRGTDGRIIRSGFYAPCDLKDKTCVVVDDICDGGRTFIELGKELRRKGATNLILYVTHGIFSQGLDELLKIYDKIYTTNSFDQSRYAGSQGLEKLIVKEIAF